MSVHPPGSLAHPRLPPLTVPGPARSLRRCHKPYPPSMCSNAISTRRSSESSASIRPFTASRLRTSSRRSLRSATICRASSRGRIHQSSSIGLSMTSTVASGGSRRDHGNHVGDTVPSTTQVDPHVGGQMDVGNTRCRHLETRPFRPRRWRRRAAGLTATCLPSVVVISISFMSSAHSIRAGKSRQVRVATALPTVRTW